MTLEQRLSNLEKFVFALSDKIDKDKFYTNADIAGNRQSVSNITPYTKTKQGYIGDTEITFNNVPSGNVSVFGLSSYNIASELGDLTIAFPALNEVTDITISVL